MSPKPWAKLEVGYMRHPKFLALSGNAIALWHEGKDYCDTQHTDGILPREVLKTFRFRGAKSIASLTSSCGAKPDGEPYAPLWEAHPIGYRMHDYLDHNDCRDEVLARLETAEDQERLRKLANAERQAKFRAERKAKIAGLQAGRAGRNERNASQPVTVTVTPRTPSVSVSVSETETETERTRAEALTRPRGARTGLLRGPRPDAAFDGGRVWVLHRTHADFMALRNGNEAELLAWYAEVAAEWTHGVRKSDEPGADMFAFWRARYAERWPAITGAKSATGKWDHWQPQAARVRS